MTGSPDASTSCTIFCCISFASMNINRDSIAEYALSLGLEGVAIISVDDDWSALRLKLV